MTLKSKLAKLKGLQSAEEQIRAEIAGLQSTIQDVELRQYNIAELRKKYSTLDFTEITPKELKELMVEDFKESNLTEIEKREIYEHNMGILAQVLEKTRRQNERINARKYTSLDEVRKAVNVNQQDEDCRSIEITGKAGEAFIDGYDTDEIDEHFDEQFLEALNEKIDVEYQFGLKILKTYCIFCHYRDIKLPSQDELDEIKEELEGWRFVPKEEYNTIKYNEEILFLNIKNFKIILKEGKYREHSKWGVKCFINKKEGSTTLNYLNPIFKKITEDDVFVF